MSRKQVAIKAMAITWRIVLFSLAIGGTPFISGLQAHVGNGRPHQHNQHENGRAIVLYHGIIPPNKAEMMIRTKELTNVAKTHHLLVLCTSSDDIPRAGKDRHIAKSAFYSITGREMRIETALTKEFLRFSAEESRTILTCFPAIVPKSVHADELTMLENVYTSGGKFVQGGVSIRADSLFKTVNRLQ